MRFNAFICVIIVCLWCRVVNGLHISRGVGPLWAKSRVSKPASISMRMVPLSTRQVRPLVPRSVSPQQWTSYWGVNSTERVQKILEALLVSYGGAWLAWFTSFMAGSLISALVGTALLFNWLYTPWLSARRKNNLIWPRKQSLRYALYSGRIRSLDRIRRRAGKTVGGISQEYLQMVVDDDKGRSLEVITPWQSGYKKLRQGMMCDTLVASPSPTFGDLKVVTDIWVPATNQWVGDYPYLDRPRFSRLVATINSGSGGGGAAGPTGNSGPSARVMPSERGSRPG